MSGMLGRAPTALVTSEVYHINNSNTNLDSSKRYCKAWPRSSSDQSSSSLLEPTSVLDIRSPSPSSTLSSSLAGSCEGGLGSIESGAVAVSGFICEGASEGQQLPDCSTSLLESHSHSHGQVRSVQEEMAGAWQQQGHNSDVRQQVWSGTTTTNSDGMMMMKPQQQTQQIVSSSPSPSPLFEQGSSREQQQGSFSFPTDKIVKSEAIADGSLEACVMPFSCRKRDREDFLGEVVQRTGHGVLKVEHQQQQQGSWAGSEWCDVKPTAIDELDEILVGSPAPPLSEFWLPEPANSGSAPAPAVPSPSQLQFQQHHQHQQNQQQQQSFANRGKQLDLYEAVQAGLLYRGSSSSPAPPPSSAELSSAPGSLLNPNFQQQVNHSVLLNPNSISRAGHGHVPQFLTQREQGSFPLRSMQLPYRSPGPFMDTKPPMFNQAAPFAPQMPQFGDSPANYPFTVPQPQFVPPKPDFVPDIKHCSIPRIIEGDPKMGGGGGIGRWPPMQKPPETGWQPPPQQRLLPGLGGFTVPEPPLLSHPRRELQVGRRVRVEELSQAERQLSAAAEAAGHGDLVMAQAILARLNQQSSPKGQQQQLIQQQQQSQLQTPSQRVTLLFSEAMAKRLPAIAAGAGVILPTLDGLSSPADIIAKIGAFKSFCEVSPIPQFAHFTANQAILEATEGEDCVHLIDFELGLGGQWASFMQEFAQRRGKAELRITTIGGETLEMKLAKENLQQFAKEVGLKLEVVVLNVDRLEMVVPPMLRRRKDDEAVVVNFGFGMRRPAAEFRNGVEGAMAFLNMIKALSPKVVTVIDSDGELGQGNSMAEAMQYYACIFESLDGTKLGREAVQGIENLVFAPKVAEVVALRAAAQGQRPPDGLFSGGVWRFLLQKAGFSSAVFSAAAQSQAACLVKNPANSGFNFHAQQGTLQLGWYNKSLISASAWV